MGIRAGVLRGMSADRQHPDGLGLRGAVEYDNLDMSKSRGCQTYEKVIREGEMKTYVISEVEMKDHDGYMKEFAPLAAKAIESGGGKFLVRGGKTGGAGPPKGRVIVVVFDSFEKAETFNASTAWQEMLKASTRYATIRTYMVEGLA
jgi:uncharacterized protein (DUF1330 family)